MTNNTWNIRKESKNINNNNHLQIQSISIKVRFLTNIFSNICSQTFSNSSHSYLFRITFDFPCLEKLNPFQRLDQIPNLAKHTLETTIQLVSTRCISTRDTLVIVYFLTQFPVFERVSIWELSSAPCSKLVSK